MVKFEPDQLYSSPGCPHPHRCGDSPSPNLGEGVGSEGQRRTLECSIETGPRAKVKNLSYGVVRSSSSAGRPAVDTRSKAGANSAVRVTTSPYAPKAWA